MHRKMMDQVSIFVLYLRLSPATDWYVRLAAGPTTKHFQVDRNLEPFDRTTLST